MQQPCQAAAPRRPALTVVGRLGGFRRLGARACGGGDGGRGGSGSASTSGAFQSAAQRSAARNWRGALMTKAAARCKRALAGGLPQRPQALEHLQAVVCRLSL